MTDRTNPCQPTSTHSTKLPNTSQSPDAPSTDGSQTDDSPRYASDPAPAESGAPTLSSSSRLNKAGLAAAPINLNDLPSGATHGEVATLSGGAFLSGAALAVSSVYAYRWLTEGNGAATLARNLYTQLIEFPILSALTIGAVGACAALLALAVVVTVARPFVPKIKAAAERIDRATAQSIAEDKRRKAQAKAAKDQAKAQAAAQ